MFNGNIQHCKGNGTASGEVQQYSGNIVVLSKEEKAQLGQLKTQGISPSRIVALNKLLADALADNDFTVFFQGLSSLLKCGKKERIRRNCRFIIYQNSAGYYVIVDSIQSVRALEVQAVGGRIYVCDLGSLGLIFPGDLPARDDFLRSIFSSTFNQEKSVISQIVFTCSRGNDVDYNVTDFYKGSLQYALEHGDSSAVRIICSSLSQFKECNSEVKKVAKGALIQIIEQQGEVSETFLECANSLLDFRTDGLDLNSEEDQSLQLQLERFVSCVRGNSVLLHRICKASYENIIKVIFHVELGELDKTVDSDESHLLKAYHERILGMGYGPDRDSIMSILVQSDSVNLLKILFDKYKLNVNAVNSYGYTALHFAAVYNAKKCAKFLLSKSSVVLNSAKSGLTPLHLAAGSDSFSVLKLLIKHNADAVNVRDHMGRNIMHHAALSNKVDNLLLCLNIGMNVNSQATVYDEDGGIDELKNNARSCTPLHLAIEEGKLEVASCLLSCQDINLSIKNTEGYTPITAVDHNGNTLLHQAVMSGRVQLLLKALHLGWQEVILERNRTGNTAFGLAIERNDVACATVLFPYVYDHIKCEHHKLKTIFSMTDSNGNSLLHQAVAACRSTLVKKILSFSDVNVMSVNADGETPLDIAIRIGSVEMVSLLVADNRQSLFSRKGGSYVMELMKKNLLTAEIYKTIKRRTLKKERYCHSKLAISLMLTFTLITCAVVLCMIKFQDDLRSIFGTIVGAGHGNTLIMGAAALVLSIICVGCGIVGGLYIKLKAREKLIHVEISDTRPSNTLDDLESVNSESSSNKYIKAYMNERSSPSESSDECESETRMLSSSLRSEKYKAIKPKRLSSVSLLNVSNEMKITSASLQ
ncbi:ankyrin repeat domain-containing protein [Ehrlichia muris]|uniref:Ankyrin n=1 Tax=Ehrlichia muris AS145 TaxID=1423892 RepID=V9R5M6_9RICK|nr:ankyrin repeat domain-containing protein [Ehrlichia muris]AHC39050.1 ankyrin [Ehrlichia muris AS145]